MFLSRGNACRAFAATALVLILPNASFAFGTTYQVSKTGPFPEITGSGGLTSVFTLAKGDIIEMGPGTYLPLDLTSFPDITIMKDPLVDPSLLVIFDGGGKDAAGAWLAPTVSTITMGPNNGSGMVLDGLVITNGNAIGRGGGIYSNGGTPTVKNCTITSNRSEIEGGGVWSGSPSPIAGGPLFENCLFLNNETNGGGGGLFVSNQQVTIDSCTFDQNLSPLEGAGVFLETTTESGLTKMEVSNSQFIGNGGLLFAPTGAGGGIAARGGVNLISTRSTFVGNSADSGGGISMGEGSYLQVDYCVFDTNSAENGGGLDLQYTTRVDISNSSFLSNEALNSGGAVRFLDTNTLPEPIDVHADFWNRRVENCLFVDNEASVLWGGAIYMENTSLDLFKCTFDMNYAGHEGGGIYSVGSSPFGWSNVDACIFWDNSDGASTTPGFDEIRNDGPGLLLVSNSNWQNGPASGTPSILVNGNLSSDPRYHSGAVVIDPLQPNPNYYLNASVDPNNLFISPCINSGGTPTIGGFLNLDGVEGTQVVIPSIPIVPDTLDIDMGFHYNALPAPARIAFIEIVGGSINGVTGGAVTLKLRAGIGDATLPRLYVLGGSLSGTSPGFAWGGSFIPLQYDTYTQYLVDLVVTPFTEPGSSPPVNVNFVGAIPEDGDMEFDFNVPAGSGMSGFTFWHAFGMAEILQVGGAWTETLASNAVSTVIQ